jgi:hypothetical protein
VTGVKWRHLYIGDLRDGNAATRVTLTSAGALALSGTSPDGATAVGVILDTAPAFTTAGAKPVSVRTGGIEKSSIDKDGGYTVAGSGNLTVPTGNKVCLDSSCTVNLIGNGSATLTSTAGIVPSANNAVSLGTSSLRWSAVNAGLINLSGTVVKYNNVSTALMRPSLLATAAVLCALWACSLYPAATCTTSCGETFTGQDCAGFSRLESATVAAFAACDAGSPDDACSALSGWTVRVLPESQTTARDDAGDREWTAPSNTEGILYAYGLTDWNTRTVSLADEHWPSGVAATELVHVAAGERQAEYSEWPSNGRACVVSTAQRAPLVLTGSEGGP